MKWLVQAFGHCWHIWTKWELADFRKHQDGKSITVTRQMRRCKLCGLSQISVLRENDA